MLLAEASVTASMQRTVKQVRVVLIAVAFGLPLSDLSRNAVHQIIQQI